MRLGRSEVPESNGDAAPDHFPCLRTARFHCINRNRSWRLPDAYPVETAPAPKFAKLLISVAHPTRATAKSFSH
jgi:hypothetical protein